MSGFTRRSFQASICGLLLATAALCSADEWPQWRGPTRDGIWREEGVVEKFANPQLKILWEAPISSGYCGPSVADGRVYVTDRMVEPKQVERVHCFDAKTGESIWSYTYDCVYDGVGYEAGPRASVLITDGRAYSLGSMGNLFCFDATNGKILWSKDCYNEYQIRMPIWGISAAPLAFEDLLIVQVGGKDACLVAFDQKTGAERWRALNDTTSYSAPILIEQAGQQVMVCWTGGSVSALNPKTGAVVWQQPFKPAKMVINVATPVLDAGRMFLTSFYDGSFMYRVPSDALSAELLWARNGRDEMHTDALQSIIGTPYIEGDYVYGVDSYGEFRCLNAATGERVWESLKLTPKSRWSTIHMVKNGDKIWMFNERGEVIITKLSPQGPEEISRAKLIDPTRVQLPQRNGVCWSHPAFAYRHIFQRNDEKIVCASLIPGEN